MGDPIPEHVREQIYHRDKYRCRMCGVTNSFGYSIHHITYRSQGGNNDPDNLITLCGSGSQGCHLMVHSDKPKYMPILQELITLHGSVTGVALLRHHDRTPQAPPDRITRRF